MKPTKRIHLLAALAALCLAPAAFAQSAGAFPSKTIRIIVPTAPGGLNDVMTRVVAQKMAENLGQAIIVENKPGGDSLLGIRFMKTVPADGYTLLATGNTLNTQLAIKQSPGYELKDFVGVGMITRTPTVLVVGANHPDNTLAELLARAKAKPDTVSYGSGGLGTSGHMAGAMLAAQSGTRLLHVPYKGAGSAITDVMGGTITMLFQATGSAAGPIRTGQVKALGVTTKQRLAGFPNIPTLAEQGLPNYSFHVYLGLLAPAGTPKPAVDRLSAALKAALASEDVRERYRKDALELLPQSPEEFTAYLRRDLDEQAELVQKLGFEKQ